MSDGATGSPQQEGSTSSTSVTRLRQLFTFRETNTRGDSVLDQRPQQRLRVEPTNHEELGGRDSAKPVCVGQSAQWYLCVLFAFLQSFVCLFFMCGVNAEIKQKLSLFQFPKVPKHL